VAREEAGRQGLDDWLQHRQEFEQLLLEHLPPASVLLAVYAMNRAAMKAKFQGLAGLFVLLKW
jgi:hypothetical protein